MRTFALYTVLSLLVSVSFAAEKSADSVAYVIKVSASANAEIVEDFDDSDIEWQVIEEDYEYQLDDAIEFKLSGEQNELRDYGVFTLFADNKGNISVEYYDASQNFTLPKTAVISKDDPLKLSLGYNDDDYFLYVDLEIYTK